MTPGRSFAKAGHVAACWRGCKPCTPGRRRVQPVGNDSTGDNTQEPSGELSGGQWQRITAGRGFYRDADLLIMDEPSSALDPRAEDALFQSIRSRQGTRTTILITHRLANVIHADRIFVLHDGRLEEQGTHAELVAAGGRYAELFTLQVAGYHSRTDGNGCGTTHDGAEG